MVELRGHERRSGEKGPQRRHSPCGNRLDPQGHGQEGDRPRGEGPQQREEKRSEKRRGPGGARGGWAELSIGNLRRRKEGVREIR